LEENTGRNLYTLDLPVILEEDTEVWPTKKENR
jgi:hypothetical protein